MAEYNIKRLADKWKQELIKEVEGFETTPYLTIITADDDNKPNQIYINNKVKTLSEIGIAVNVVKIPSNYTRLGKQYLIEKELAWANVINSSVIIQMPCFDFTQKEITNMLEDYSHIDCDGMSRIQQEYLSDNDERALMPATALGVLKIIKDKYGDNLEGKSIGIFNRSHLVGLPLFKIALNENMTPTICHSRTKIIDKHIAFGNSIVVTACGQRKIFGTEMIGICTEMIIDCSMHRQEGISGVGDLDKEEILEDFPSVDVVSGYGATGITTVIALAENVIKAHKLNNK